MNKKQIARFISYNHLKYQDAKTIGEPGMVGHLEHWRGSLKVSCRPGRHRFYLKIKRTAVKMNQVTRSIMTDKHQPQDMKESVIQ